jgi:hypothetical protein
VYSVVPDSIRYQFTSSEPVPEPGTFLLVGGMLVGLGLARAGARRRRPGREPRL